MFVKCRILYPEWSHMQCVGLAYPWTRVRAQVCRQGLYRATRGAQGVLLMRVGGATSQLDLPSLT